MEEMGFTREEIRDSLENNKFNNVTATYFLLGTDRPAITASSTNSPSTGSKAADDEGETVAGKKAKAAASGVTSFGTFAAANKATSETAEPSSDAPGE